MFSWNVRCQSHLEVVPVRVRPLLSCLDEDLEGAATDWGAQLYEDCGKKLGDIVAMLM